jgi:predicted regulator of Ras-like GTPase activity (Roadblock/LC7/MglB family)
MEIVQRTSALRGVAGTLIAMQDGLLVADQMPPGLPADTFAAFVPQLFGRLSQYTKELKLGEASSVTVVVEDAPLKIFKAGGVYFTALGQAAQPLPDPELNAIAAYLGRQTQ